MATPQATYQNLESQPLSQITGKPASQTTVIEGKFFATSEFIYTALFVAIIAAAFYRYALAGIWRMAASEKYIKMSNEEFRRVTLGLLGVFSMFIVIYTFNKDLLKGDVGLSDLKVTPAIVGGGGGVFGGGGATGSWGTPSPTGSGGVTSSTCTPTQDTISALASGNICGNTQCTALAGCNYAPYLPLLRAEAQNKGVSLKMLIVIMCKESRAVANADHTNTNGTHDCGLMQVNQSSACTPAVLDPATNIAAGAQELKNKLSAQTYQSVPAAASVFAAYNCCSTGNANAPSADCNSSTGFPNPIPKWGCPISPGPTDTNMCFVKNYACEASACLSDPSLNNL